METIKLDLIPGKKMPSLHASQFDDGREHGIDLFENGVVYKLDGTETLTINERKGDDCICSLDIENTFTGSNHIVFSSTEQMCAVWGNNICELVIAKGEKTIGSLNFILEVEPSPTEGGIESESEISNLERQIEEITEQVIGDDYYTAEQTDEAIATAIEDKADTTYVDEQLNNKMDKASPVGTGSFSLNRKDNTTVGEKSVAMGNNATASGENSMAIGNNSFAHGANSVAMGDGTRALGANQFVFGKHNKDNNYNNYVEIVGKGNAFTRSNARTLDWQGNETLAGDVIINGNQSVSSEITRLDGRIDNLPKPVIFKGTLGVGGTVTELPVASESVEGWEFKCITEGTYAGVELKVGDTVTCFNPPNTSVYEWEKTGSQDTDTDTWRNIKVNGVEKLGNGISSGAVDFEDTANVKFEFDANGNKVRAKLDGIYTDSEVDDLLDDKADADNTYTKAQVDDIVYNILPDDTASGSVASFETDLALPIKSLEVDVNAVQESGTPTPATPLPISGWSEINLYKLGGNFFNKKTVTNGFLINGSGNEVSYADWNISDFIPVVEGASYYLYGLTVHPNTNQDNFELFNASKVKVGYANIKTNEQPYVIPSGVAYIKCCVKNQDIDTTQLGVSVNSSFVPYNPVIEKTVINLGGTYYGGHFTQDKDGHRQFEVTHSELLDMGDIEWSNFDATYSIFRATQLPNCKAPVSTADRRNGFLCTDYPASANVSINENMTDKSLLRYNGWIILRDTSFSSYTELASGLSGAKLIYELAEPIIIDLPDGEPITTLNGTNNIYADTGDTSVVFKDSVNGYVEEKIASVQALVLNT